MKKKAIVIIPTYNERENIRRLVPALQEVFADKMISDWDLGILVVDDTSPDKTYEVVADLQRKHKNLYLLVNKKKSGLGGAYLKGMAHAFIELKADVIFEFDADFSHDPKKIPQFLAAIDRGADMVLGSRYIRGGGIPKNWGFHRKFLSVVGNIIIAVVLTNFKIRDWTTGYRAITRKVYDSVHRHLDSERFSGYTFQIGFLHRTVQAGYKVVEVPFMFVDRTHGKSKLGPEYIKNTLMYIIKVRIEQLLQSKVFKFVMVGGFGALVQLMSLQLYRFLLPEFQISILTKYLLATLLSIETAIVSNFIFNNIWTFSDRKLKPAQIPSKFVQFNLTSMGSLLIQLAIAAAGQQFIGIFDLFTLPILNVVVDTGMVFAVVGILVGMFWNFFAYTTFIWKKKK
jgi:dolichol-phosphate mannosyltransferase